MPIEQSGFIDEFYLPVFIYATSLIEILHNISLIDIISSTEANEKKYSHCVPIIIIPLKSKINYSSSKPNIKKNHKYLLINEKQTNK